MIRKNPEPEQFNLFSGQANLPGDQAAPPSTWVAQHWPDYVSGRRRARPSAAVALVRWAESIPELSKGARALLFTLAREVSGEHSSCTDTLLNLAVANGIARNTCRRYLDELLSAGLIMMKIWRELRSGGILGYEFRLIADVEDRAAAAADGFWSCRPLAGTAAHSRKTGRSA